MIISFMSANFVARELGYDMPGGWSQGDRAANDYFRPPETYAERFEELLQEVVDMGFTAIDLWLAHLNPRWATDDQVETARRLLEQYELPVISLAGNFGNTREEFERSCEIATALDTTILGGNTPLVDSDRDFVVQTLEKYGVRLGLENHPEKTPQVMLDKVGDGGNGTIGVTIDTGWFGTQGYDAAQAIYELKDCLFHVHLKDVLDPAQVDGKHVTCRYGDGIVPLEACVRALQEIGYDSSQAGGISIEHEPEDYDPRADIIAGREMVEQWLGK